MRKNWGIRIACLAGLVGAVAANSSAVAQPAIMDFEEPAVSPGTMYGMADPSNVDVVVLSQDGIDMAMEFFLVPPSLVNFNYALVGGQHAHFFPSTPLELNNISAQFDLSGVGFSVTQVTLDYMEFGGINNFSVNGSFHAPADITDIPAMPAPGVTAVVGPDTITLTGPVHSFTIGGQELSIDNVVVVPEPATSCLLLLGAATLYRRRRA